MLSRNEIFLYAVQNVDRQPLTSRETFLSWGKGAFQKRGEALGRILDEYAKFKKRSYCFSIIYQSVFFWLMILLLIALTVLAVLGLVYSSKFKNIVVSVSTIITISASYFGSLFSILNTIAKYLFPESGVKQENDFINSISKDNQVLLSMIDKYEQRDESSDSDPISRDNQFLLSLSSDEQQDEKPCSDSMLSSDEQQDEKPGSDSMLSSDEQQDEKPSSDSMFDSASDE